MGNGDGVGGRSGDGTAAGGWMRDRNVQFSESAAPRVACYPRAGCARPPLLSFLLPQHMCFE